MSISKKKVTATCAAGVAALTLICASVCALIPFTDMTVNASTEETENSLRVFIGDVNGAPEGYVQQRAEYAEMTAKADADEVIQAVIGFDDYYTVEEIAALVGEYDIVINRAYMWPEGETGRLSLYVTDNNIEKSLNAYEDQVAEKGYCEQDEQFAEDHQRLLNGEYGIFALTATAPADALAKFSAEADCISYVDVMYNVEAEKYAKKVGKAVSYIELPSKPDGAL